MARKSSLEVLEDLIAKYAEQAKTCPDGALYISGSLADRAGSFLLENAANRLGCPIIVEGKSEAHEGAVFQPKTLQ